MRTAGFVLVGGQSSRMGRDKALLPWAGHTLVEDVAAQVIACAGSVALVGRPERYRSLGLECLADIRAGLGPLAGMEAALASGRGDLNLILACDMAQMPEGWLKTLLRTAQETDAACVVTKDALGTVHPLCGVYRSSCLPAIREALDERRLRLQAVVEQLDAVILHTAESIRNVNTPDEWAALAPLR